MLSAMAGSDRLDIIASRDRWAELFREAMTGQIRDDAEIARDMFIRGEIEVSDLERALE